MKPVSSFNPQITFPKCEGVAIMQVAQVTDDGAASKYNSQDNY